ncbi:SusC/RagA family TonB-linked outer membrane protein [Kriegella sp. EG-1]|nr:SusC/RagA family TonB-linked outer membrane protein [Flavobacteriaceae bacterium EG-1]
MKKLFLKKQLHIAKCFSILFICCIIGTNIAYADIRINKSYSSIEELQSTITGNVTDENGSPLPGASVVVKGTTTGAVTDFDGNYSISASSDAVLLISYVGYQTAQVSVNGKSVVNVGLEVDASQLDEVVVVGYGTQRKGEVTAAISTVGAETIEKIATPSSVDAVKGQIAGVDIQSDGGRPGQNSTIRIRGRRSITATNDPLYVIDGIPQISGNETIADINPQDIESMNILKDAAATAIYGSRGANGVVLITTKRGRVGEDTKVRYSSRYGVTSVTRTVDMMNGVEYANMKREANRTAWNGTIPADDVVFEDPIELESIALGRSVDYLDLVLDAGWQTDHQISVSGGSEKTNFNTSLGYFNEQGIISSQDFERVTARINLDHKISDTFKVGMSFTTSHSVQNWGSNAVMSEALAAVPLGQPYDENGELRLQPTNDGIRTNPLSELVENAYIDERKVTRIFAPFYLNINIADGLKWTTNFGPDIRYYRRGLFRGSETNTHRNGPPDAQVYNDQSFGYTLENILNYNKNFFDDRHSLGVTLLQSIQGSRLEKYQANVQNLPYEEQLFYNLQTAETNSLTSSSLEEWKLASFMGRVNYDIDGKYLLQASLRADGSSRLAPGSKWTYFPGASIGWRMSQENFLVDSNVVNDLKLRASYGEVGNTAIDPYSVQGTLGNSVYGWADSSALGFSLSDIPNPALGWEISKTINFGVDYALFNNRINGSLDYYKTKTEDLLLNRGVPYTSGYEDALINVGETETTGFELALNTSIVQNPEGFNWDMSVNFTLPTEQIIDVDQRDENGNIADDVGNNWFIGQPLGTFYDYRKIGIWQADEAAEALAMEDKVPGEIKLEDVNGDGVITPDDRVIIGSDIADYFGGITNSFSYKGIDLSFFFYFKQGQTIRSRFHDSNNSLFGRYNNLDVDYWTIDNPTNASPRPNQNQESPRNSSTLSYFDGSYLKLRNVTLGYNFPNKLCEQLKISNLRLYLAGQNLWFISDYDTFDPEVSEADNTNGSGVFDGNGVSSSTVPSNKMFSVGLNVTF